MRQDSLNSRCLTVIGNITKMRMLDVQLLTKSQNKQVSSVDFCLIFFPPEIETRLEPPSCFFAMADSLPDLLDLGFVARDLSVFGGGPVDLALRCPRK